jgi:hypothetical protein
MTQYSGAARKASRNAPDEPPWLRCAAVLLRALALCWPGDQQARTDSRREHGKARARKMSEERSFNLMAQTPHWTFGYGLGIVSVCRSPSQHRTLTWGSFNASPTPDK